MQKKDLSHIVILILSVLLLSLPFLSRINTIEEYSTLDELFFKRAITSSLFVVVFFIINYYVLIPKLYFQKKYVLYGGIVILGLYLTYFLPTLVVATEEIRNAIIALYPNHTNKFAEKSLIEKVLLDRNSYAFYLTFIIALVLRTHRKLQAMEHLRVQSELSYLKAQINPHFLFNTLNSIYALSLMKSDQTPKAIIKLSSLMRYVVTESEKEWIPIQQEIQYINDFIELQKLRLDDATTIELQTSTFTKNWKIAPMLLVPFIENAFKYGVSPGHKSSISISIVEQDDQLKFVCINQIIPIDVSTIEKTGTGINNTSKRLQAIYNNAYTLDIKEENSNFIVKLTLPTYD